MYIVTEYQYQLLRNYCKDAVVDEIGRQHLNEEQQNTQLCNCEQLFIGCAITGANCKTRGLSNCT